MNNEIMDDKAIKYAEKYGIIEYEVKNNTMIYYTNYPQYSSNQRYTMKVVVDLITMKEVERTKLKRWNKKGAYNFLK